MKKHFNRVFPGFVFAYSFVFASRPLTDPDFWFHLKTGQYILTNHVIPRADLFSFTNYGRPWIAHEWLSEAIFYFLYSRFGLNSLIIIFALLAVTAFWIVFRCVKAHPFIKAFAVLLSVWTIVPTIGVRPRVFTLFLAGVFLYLLNNFVNGKESRAIWWLVPLTVLWVNLHAGFVIGLVLIVITIIGVLFDSWAASGGLSPVTGRVRSLTLVLLSCLAVVLINPHGPRIYYFPFEFLFSPVQQQLVTDWFSPDFHETALLPLAALLILTMAAMAISPQRPKPSEVLLFVATLYATLKSSRHMAIFALVAGPLLAEYAQSWMAASAFGRGFSEGPKFESSGSALLLLIALLLPLIGFAVQLRTRVFSPASQEILNVPVKAVNYLRASQITGNTFTDPNIWGDYLIWALPSNPVYIDGRIDMYPGDFVKQYRDITLGLADWRRPFDQYEVRAVILRRNSPLISTLADAHWQQRYEDEMAVVLTR